jgi:hypothetical protein
VRSGIRPTLPERVHRLPYSQLQIGSVGFKPGEAVGGAPASPHGPGEKGAASTKSYSGRLRFFRASFLAIWPKEGSAVYPTHSETVYVRSDADVRAQGFRSIWNLERARMDLHRRGRRYSGRSIGSRPEYGGIGDEPLADRICVRGLQFS